MKSKKKEGVLKSVEVAECNVCQVNGDCGMHRKAEITTEKSVEEIVKEFNTEFIWDNAEKPSHEKSNWLRKTLQAERQKREEVVEVIYRDIRETGATCPEAYGFEGAETFPDCGKCIICKALAQPNNPK